MRSFLMIGFELFAIALVLMARLAAVGLPILALRPFCQFSLGIMPILTWGGLKGGISVALALALPDSEWRLLILTATYVVVVFSIIVQRLTLFTLANRLGREPDLM